MKIVLNNLTDLSNEITAVGQINLNNNTITAAWDNTLSRDGTSPNTMLASLDMNSNHIINLPVASTPTEPVRLQEFTNALLHTGQIFDKNSVGLSNVDNTSDLNKPVSTATAAAIAVTGGKPLVVLITGQSFLTVFQTLTWTPAPNLSVWNFNGVTGNVGTAYSAPTGTTITLPLAYLSRLARENPTRAVYGIVIGFGGQSISHWLAGATTPDVYQNILNNMTTALAAVTGSPTTIDRFVWMQGQGDCVPVTATYVADHATMMTRFWGNSWFPRETRCDIFSIASVADGDPLNTDADKMNDLLLAVTNADPDKRRYFYVSSLSGATYWDATNPGHPTAAGAVAMAQLIGRSNLSSVVNDPATKQLVFGNPTYPGNGNSIVTINANLSQAILLGPPTGTVSHIVGANGAAAYHVLDNFGGSGNELIGRSAGGTLLVPVATPADSLLIGVASESFDGTGGTFTSVNGAFQIYSNGLQSGANHGTYALLYLTPNGSTAVTQVARFDPGSFTINGTTSGRVTIAVPAVAGSNTLTLPAGTTNFSATGGASQVLKQTSTGGAFTVAQLAISDISGLAAGGNTFLSTGTSANLAAMLTDETGTGAAVFGTSPNITAPNIIGTVAAGNAAAGSVGEYISSIIASGSAVSMTTATGVNVTSISLTAGDWDVWALTFFITAATTNITQLISSISNTTGTVSILGDRAGITTYGSAGTVPGVAHCGVPMIQTRINVSTTTTIFLVGQPSFTVSTLTAWGSLQARRVR